MKSRSPVWIIVWLLFFFPVGFYLLWTNKNWSRNVKIWVTVAWVGVALLGMIASATSSTSRDPHTTQTAATNESQSTPTPQVIDQMKQDYIFYYKQYMAIANKSDTTNTKVINDIQLLGNGMTTADMYIEAKDAHDTQEELKQEEVQLTIPDSLSDYHDDLQQASDALFSLIDERSSAMNNVASYLNTNDLEQIRSLRNSVQQQQTDMEEAVVKLVTVGNKLGVDTSKIQTSK